MTPISNHAEGYDQDPYAMIFGDECTFTSWSSDCPFREAAVRCKFWSTPSPFSLLLFHTTYTPHSQSLTGYLPASPNRIAAHQAPPEHANPIFLHLGFHTPPRLPVDAHPAAATSHSGTLGIYHLKLCGPTYMSSAAHPQSPPTRCHSSDDGSTQVSKTHSGVHLAAPPGMPPAG